MFSSTNNSVSVNPFLPSPPLPPSFIFNHFDERDIFLHHHDPPLTTHNFSLPSANNTRVNNHNKMGPLSNNKPSLKKNRHSKIRTAQGLRDRRVRLSIGVARKFFDLQDTLGFDKASKTLEWLLTKSKTSIMELTVNSGSGGGEEVVDNNGGPARINKLIRKGAIHKHSKELREKARERARARTRAKLCTKKTQSPHTSFIGNFCDDKSVPQVELPSFQPLPNPVSRADIIEESIVIKRKLKPPVSNFAYHQNFVTSKDVTTIIANNCLPSLPQSWDNSSAITRSSFYAMINDNLSTEIQLYGKPWEAHNNNQSLH